MNRDNYIEIIATLPPDADHRQYIIDHPYISALRYNSITPSAEPRSQALARLRRECGDKPLALDLKARQLRVTRTIQAPVSFVQLSHPVTGEPPFEIFFKGSTALVTKIVDGRRLILKNFPSDRWVIAGEAVNILDPRITIDGCLTPADRAYLRLGIHHQFQLSFTESAADLEAVWALDSAAEITAKIESRRGLAFIENEYPKYAARVRLMAACDDLYINMGSDKIDILDALQQIIAADPRAIAASRIMTSCERKDDPGMSDLTHFELLYRLGYKKFMLSDRLCADQRAFNSAMHILAGFYQRFARQP
jgi:hypothetical protein